MAKKKSTDRLAVDLPTLDLGPEASARRAGLRYVSDETPGLTRKPWGRGFSFFDVDGRRITDENRRARLKALGIPPAYTDVWICPDPKGHLQATGRDDKGRKQYLYHPKWSTVRQRMKFDRLVAFGAILSTLRAQCARDLRRDELPQSKVLALVVRLLDHTLIRIGSDAYAQENDSFGLTTLRRRHVRFAEDGGGCTFAFAGKSGQAHEIVLDDPALTRAVQACCDVPGYEIFAFFDEEDQKRDVKAHHVNAYLRQATGEDFTAKHFRTWGGTVHAARTLDALGPADSEKEVDNNLAEMVKAVADKLGNTVAVCREYYIHPALFEHYRAGTLLERWRSYLDEDSAPHLSPAEHATLLVLRDQLD